MLCLKRRASSKRFKYDRLKHRASASVIQNGTPFIRHLTYSFCHVVVVASAAPLIANKFHGSSLGFLSAVFRAPLFA